MSKSVLHIVFIFSFLSAFAQQNLVPNGSFEEYYNCPNYIDGYTISSCKDWKSPSLGSPDYFNSCSTEFDNSQNTLLFSVPQNYYGNESAHTGNAYAGIVFAQDSANLPAYSEYIQVELIEGLEIGQSYKLCFFVHNPKQICFNSIGALFTSHELIVLSDDIISFTPSFKSNPVYFFCDTNNWTSIEYVFFADGTERFLTLGVFSPIPEIQAVNYDGSEYQSGISAYLYIDDVSIIETDFVMTNVFTPDGDGINDFFNIDLKALKASKISISNRWGNTIIETNKSLSWDGTSNGYDCVDGIYFYSIEFENGKTINGFISLMR